MVLDMRVIGYEYRSGLYCPGCLVGVMIEDRELSPAARDMAVERVLDDHAEVNVIDRCAESTYSSDEHPHRVFAHELGCLCDSCWRPLS